MKHAYESSCECSRCTKESARRSRQSDTRGPVEWSESARGYRARERWARAYYDRNGAPEGDSDR